MISSLCYELSPTCTLKWPGCNRVRVTCNTSSVFHVQHAMYHAVRRDSSAIEPDRVEITFIFALSYWLKPSTDEGGGENQSTRRKPPTKSDRKTLALLFM